MRRRLYEVRKSLKMTQKQMADILKIGQNAYSMIETGKIELTQRNRIILESELHINPDFLTDGTLPMTLNPARSTTKNTKKNDSSQNNGVPYYAKSISSTSNTPYDINPLDAEYYIDFEPFNDCSFYRPIYGHSMSPRYNSGDIIACKKIQSKSNIMYGQCYLCVIENEGDHYETLQILRKCDDENQVALMPFNSSFDSFIVPLSAIKELYLICGKIERSV